MDLSNVFKGNWKQVKGEMQRLWGKITDDEWEETKGDAKKMAGLVQKKYGLNESEAQEKIKDITSRYQH